MEIFAVLLFFAGLSFVHAQWVEGKTRISRRQLRALKNLPVTPIGELRPGRVKVQGKIDAERTEPTIAGTVPCVWLERRYVFVNGNQRTYRTESYAFPFRLTDASGSLTIDPRGLVVDGEYFTPEKGAMTERGLRAGDMVMLLGELHDGAFRAEAATFRDDDVLKVPLPIATSLSWVALGAGFAWCLGCLVVGSRELLLGAGAIAAMCYAYFAWSLHKKPERAAPL